MNASGERSEAALVDNLLIARDNRYGLTRDAVILAEAIRSTGASVEAAGTRQRHLIDRLLARRVAHRNIHLERAFPLWNSAGEENVLIPNQERFPRRHIGRLRHVDLVLAKTRHAEAIFSKLGVKTAYLGFTSQDSFDPSVTRDWSRFFHLSGGSTLKGTSDLVALWARHPEWPELVLIQKAENAPRHVPANVTLHSGYVDEATLRNLQNSCGIHLCPSLSEGWGHHIVEGLSCGAVVLTTDAPPMNEHVSADFGILVPFTRSEPRHLGTNYFVDVGAMEAAIEDLIHRPVDEKRAMGEAARARYLDIDAGFRQRVAALLGHRPAGVTKG